MTLLIYYFEARRMIEEAVMAEYQRVVSEVE
jgi:ABC-type tungstate transport system substrate-binding protein